MFMQSTYMPRMFRADILLYFKMIQRVLSLLPLPKARNNVKAEKNIVKYKLLPIESTLEEREIKN